MAQAAVVSATVEGALTPDAGVGVLGYSPEGTRCAETPDYLLAALEDAERLLKYSAESGMEVEDVFRNSVLRARTADAAGWDEETAANLLSALAKLAARMRPVTAESLKACGTQATRIAVRTYWIVAICLAMIIVPFSAASFVASA